MSNEPVAWANKDDLDRFDMRVRTSRDNYHSVPLYTHPVDDTALLRQALEALGTCVCAMQDYQAGIGITEMFDKGERKGRLILPALRARLEGEQ